MVLMLGCPSALVLYHSSPNLSVLFIYDNAFVKQSIPFCPACQNIGTALVMAIDKPTQTLLLHDENCVTLSKRMSV